MRVLAFGAHPDDVEFQIGGTLAKYAARKDEIFIAVATNGNIGSFRMSKEEIAKVRRAEAQKAADLLGAHLIFMDFDDEFLMDTVQTRLKFIDAVRVARPDVMFSHEPYNDYNPDHDMVGYLAFIARINASIKLIETEHPPTGKVPALFHYSTLARILRGRDGHVRDEKADVSLPRQPAGGLVQGRVRGELRGHDGVGSQACRDTGRDAGVRLRRGLQAVQELADDRRSL